MDTAMSSQVTLDPTDDRITETTTQEMERTFVSQQSAEPFPAIADYGFGLRIERGERRELSGTARRDQAARGVRAVTFYSGRMASFPQLRRSRASTGLAAVNIAGVD
jgi:hypothetical protein